jgi:hypothetical protein
VDHGAEFGNLMMMMIMGCGVGCGGIPKLLVAVSL